MKLNAFVTAGGRISGEFAEKTGTEIKALIKINGKSIIRRTIDALKESGVINRIALIAPVEMKNLPDVEGADTFIPADLCGVENIRKGLEYFKNDKYTVLCTSDLPLISGDAVRDFISRCPDEASICYPIFEEKEINPKYLPAIPSYIKLKEGKFTGGSIFRLDTALCLEKMDKIGKSFLARKSALGMAMLLGPVVTLKFALGICSLEDLLGRVEKLMGGRCVAVRGCDPAITVDIDDQESYNCCLSIFFS